MMAFSRRAAKAASKQLKALQLEARPRDPVEIEAAMLRDRIVELDHMLERLDAGRIERPR